jgi:dTDP-4-amino-4,6-dideoxygalactose transaminase
VWHLFVVQHARRDDLRRYLEEAGIGSLIHYPTPPHLSPAYAQRRWEGGRLPITERLAGNVLSLPMGPHLQSADAFRVSAAVKRFIASGGRAAA